MRKPWGTNDERRVEIVRAMNAMGELQMDSYREYVMEQAMRRIASEGDTKVEKQLAARPIRYKIAHGILPDFSSTDYVWGYSPSAEKIRSFERHLADPRTGGEH